jgi:glycosyltransferase involved in cell wall biosynthesis
MKFRVVILTEIIAPYRIPVFNALAQHPEVDLHVIFLAETDPTLRDWPIYKDEMRFSYQILPSWRRRIGRYNLLLNWGLRRAMRRASPDVIICGGYNYFALWESLWWAHRHRAHFMVWVESTSKDLRGGHALVEFLKAKFVCHCDALIVAGKSSFDYMRSFGTGEDRIFTAPDAVDNTFFERQAELSRGNEAELRQTLRLQQRFFLFVGRLVAEKGVFDLLRAYGTLAPELRSKIGLVFVGEGAERGELERQASGFSPGSVRFAGFAQREQLAVYYALAEALVFPTHTDPWGLVVNEAMACGLPIICSCAAGCAADLVEDHWNGRIVPPGDAGQLASAMEELSEQVELRILMSQRSRERIRKFSPELCAAGIVEAVMSCGVSHHA